MREILRGKFSGKQHTAEKKSSLKDHVKKLSQISQIDKEMGKHHYLKRKLQNFGEQMKG